MIPDGQGGFILQSNPGQANYNTHWRINAQGDILWVRDHLSWWFHGDIIIGGPEYFYLSFANYQIGYAQKVRISDGQPLWPNNWQQGQYGALLTTPPPHYYVNALPRSFYQSPYLYSTYSYTFDSTIYNHRADVMFAQKLNAQGNRQWGDMGVALTATRPPFIIGSTYSDRKRTAPDGEGGCVAAWENLVGGTIQHDVFAKRVNADGTLGGPFPLNVTISPHNPPIQIPPQGGSFSYDLAVADTDSVGGTFDLWVEATLPNGNHLEITHRQHLPIAAMGTFTRSNLQQTVPGNAPPGNYTYTIYAGNYDYKSPWGQDSFTFVKLGTGNLDQETNEWTLYGLIEVNTGHSIENNAVINTKPLINATSAEGTVSYILPHPAPLSLTLYDLLGRKIALLEEGYHPAGTGSARLDHLHLPTGIYLLRLEAGGEVAVGKVVILK
jgi:hypothetical protein